MLNHISIAVNEPEKVANVIAEFWNGIVIPFPPAPGSFMALANDGKGSGVEVLPAGTVLIPGEGFPQAENVDTPTDEYEAKFVHSDSAPKYVATHLNISTHLDIDEIKAIANREGWRVLVCNRAGGMFQLVEVWIEDQFMLEVMTPEQTARYREITDPEFIARVFGDGVPGHHGNAPTAPAADLSLIG